MKKIIRMTIIFAFVFMILTSCDNVQNNNNNNGSGQQNNTNENNNQDNYLENLSIRDKVSKTLYDIGIDLFNNKKYESYKTNNETYYLNINNIKDLGYNVEILENCENDTTGITIDPLNKEKLDYKEYPILIHVFCEFE
ncbi:MAG: hypothetical protein IJB83_06310 [Bacilli bacterium]|nr:hypothetical protein [Bacilli bacterium]